MPNLRIIDEQLAQGEVAEIYQTWRDANPDRDKVPGILTCFGYRADVLRNVLSLCYPLQFADGALTRRQKELIATYVSALNQCPY